MILRLRPSFLAKSFRERICARHLSDTLSLKEDDPLSGLSSVELAYDDFCSGGTASDQPALLMLHGMLGCRHNFTSLAKALHRDTGRRVLTVDARNHGDSPHSADMTYRHMAADLDRFIRDKDLGRVSLLGHSMGGRAVMLMALLRPELIEKLVVADISPVNHNIDDDIKSSWHMEYFFHCLKNVQMRQDVSLSEARKDADQQLAVRIKEPARRAWLLMNMIEDPELGTTTWRVNLEAIHRNFKDNIARFPPVGEAVFMKPTLFLGGAESDYIQVTDHDEIKEMFPLAQFSYIPGAGHWLHSDNPSKFIELVQRFLKN